MVKTDFYLHIPFYLKKVKVRIENPMSDREIVLKIKPLLDKLEVESISEYERMEVVCSSYEYMNANLSSFKNISKVGNVAYRNSYVMIYDLRNLKSRRVLTEKEKHLEEVLLNFRQNYIPIC